MPENVYVIAVEISTPLQRDQIQAFIKEESESWWHGLADLWIVKGKTSEEWRNSLRSFFPNPGTGNVLVLKVDPDEWSYRSWTFTDSQKKWLGENLGPPSPKT